MLPTPRPRHPYPALTSRWTYELSLFRYFNLAATPAHPRLHPRPGNPGALEADKPVALSGCCRMSEGWPVETEQKISMRDKVGGALD